MALCSISMPGIVSNTIDELSLAITAIKDLTSDHSLGSRLSARLATACFYLSFSVMASHVLWAKDDVIQFGDCAVGLLEHWQQAASCPNARLRCRRLFPSNS
jgi:hypothetical protein